MLSLLIQVSLGQKFIQSVAEYPKIHREVIRTGDEFIIRSNYPRTLYSLVSIPDGFEFIVTEDDHNRTVKHSAENTFLFLEANKSALYFFNLTGDEVYSIVSIGFNYMCSGDIYASNQNWASNPTKGENIINCQKGKECCFLVAGLPSRRITIDYYYTQWGYLKMLESDGGTYHIPASGDESRSKVFLYGKISSVKPLLFQYSSEENAELSYFHITNYSVESETMTNAYPSTFTQGFSKPIKYNVPLIAPGGDDATEPTKKFPVYAVVVPVVLVVVIVIAVVVGVILYKKRKNGVNGKSSRSSSSSS